MRKNLFLGFLAVILLIWIVCIYTITNTNDVREIFIDLESDIIVGAISIIEAKATVADMKGRSLSYITTGNENIMDKTKKEILQKDWATLKENLVKHLERESRIGPDERDNAEKMLDLSRRLVSVSVEVVDMKDRGVGTEELMEKMQKEFRPTYLYLSNMFDEHLAIHEKELSAAENEFHVIYDEIIRNNIKITILITLIVLLIGLVVDRLFVKYITNRKLAEEALRESERKLNEAQSIAHIGSWDIDYTTDAIYHWSDEMYRIFNQIPETFTPTYDQILELIHPDDQEDFTNLLIETLQNRQESFTHENRIINPDGSIRYVLTTGNVVYDQKDTPLRTSGVAQDITERKRIERELIDAQKMQAVGTLAGGIAHDFNNIMTTVLGYASYLAKKVKEDDPFYKGLDAIEKSAIRASELTAQLLHYARKGSFEIKTTNLNHIVKNTKDIILKAFDKSIDIELKTKGDLKNIDGDESQLSQMVMNLAINAKEAMKKGGALVIETFQQELPEEIVMNGDDVKAGEYVCLKVTDTGTGMDEKTLSRIFEPYFSTKDDMTSTGLGMSVVYGVVKRHGGYIDVKSKLGSGTEVTVFLPTAEKIKKKKDEAVTAVVGGTETILVMDDEDEVLSMLESILEGSGYKVLTSLSGKSGLEIYKEKSDSIDLVVLDIMMPKMGGDEVFMKLLEIDPSVKVLLSSGYSNREQHKDIIALGAKGFVGKPFVADKILREIREALG